MEVKSFTANFSRRHPLSPLAVILIALLLTGGLYAGLSAWDKAAADDESSIKLTDDDIKAGENLFLANCASCHGIGAVGTDKAVSLIDVGAAAVDFQVGTGRMPAAVVNPQFQRKPVELTDRQRHQLAAYVGSLSGQGAKIPDLKDIEQALSANNEEIDVTAGGELFRVNCAMCHNAVGAGGALTQGKFAPPLENVDATYIYEAMVTGPQAMPIFSDVNLPPKEKLEIINYLKTVQEQGSPGGFKLGSLGPVAEGLFIWIFGLSVLIGFTIWITRRSA